MNLRRIARWSRLAITIGAEFEVTGDASHVVRRTSVYKVAARGRVWNPALAREVIEVMRSLGASPVANGNRRLFVGVRARGASEDEVAEVARACRHDPREQQR